MSGLQEASAVLQLVQAYAHPQSLQHSVSALRQDVQEQLDVKATRENPRRPEAVSLRHVRRRIQQKRRIETAHESTPKDGQPRAEGVFLSSLRGEVPESLDLGDSSEQGAQGWQTIHMPHLQQINDIDQVSRLAHVTYS